MSEPINRFYYGYLSKREACLSLTDGNQFELERLMLECVREAFQAGARWQLHETAKLSPYISKFLEMVVLLGPDSPRDAWLEIVDAMPHAGEDSGSLEDLPYDVPEERDDIPF
jgi:hypothetical protein